jgi:hypothetical protein
MTHTGTLAESAGVFRDSIEVERRCATCCLVTRHRAQCWESSDGAYEDYKYTCLICGRVHWVDGDDG